MINISQYTLDEYATLAKSFHGSAAPGIIIGGFMVETAMKNLPEGEFFDAISETSSCLPDAIQLLTPCTIGNGWLKIVDSGRYALSLYEKFCGSGIRVYLDSSKIQAWPEIKSWFFKEKPKREQDYDALIEEICAAGADICSIETVSIKPEYLEKRSKGDLGVCPSCHEAYPKKHGAICLSCQGNSPYTDSGSGTKTDRPSLSVVSIEKAEGKELLHDMTRIMPGKEKGAAFTKGQIVSAGDICRLQKMGRQRVYIEEDTNPSAGDWVHEDKAAQAFADAMAGSGISPVVPPREGKVNLAAADDGLLIVDRQRLNMFNLMPNVMCASMHGYCVVEKDTQVAGTRAIPLYLSRQDFEKAKSVLSSGPIFSLAPMRKANVGILVTGTEVFKGLIEDSFAPIIRARVEKYGCTVIREKIVPDDAEAIRKAVQRLRNDNADLIITTAGLSVDPDDVTRQGLIDAGLTNLLYGTPILPGAMTLVGNIGDAQVIGVPACALYYKTTAFDLLLPRLLAGLKITRDDLAYMGHGSYCLNCSTCTYPHCAFGK